MSKNLKKNLIAMFAGAVISLSFALMSPINAHAEDVLQETKTITHTHSATNTTPCYEQEDVYSNVNCSSASMDWIVSGGNCPFCGASGTYREIKHEWTCSECHANKGTSYTKYCSSCGSHDVGSGGACYHTIKTGTKWTLTCTHTNENLGSVSLYKNLSTVKVEATATNFTITGYSWGGKASGASSSATATGIGTVTATVTYKDNYSGTTGSVTLSCDMVASDFYSASISADRDTSNTNWTNENVTFTCTTSGETTTGYRWYKDGSPISGATNSTYVATSKGSYYCVATATSGTQVQTNAIYTYIDKTSPAGSVTTNAMNEWSGSNVTLTADVTDAESGLNTYNWHIENENHTVIEGTSQTTVIDQDGIWTGTVTVTDKAGNNTVLNIPETKVDLLVPTVSITNNHFISNNGITNQNIILSANVNSMPISGVTYKWEKNVSGVYTTVGTSETLSLTEEQSNTTYRLTVTSNSGHSGSATFTITIDKTAPTGTITSDQVGEWTYDNVRLTAHFTDNEEISGYQWNLSNGITNITSTSETIDITQSGVWTGTLNVQDTANNGVFVGVSIVKIDKSTPDVEILGSTADGNLDTNDLTNKNVTLHVVDRETHLCNVTYTWYRNGVALTETSDTLVISEEEIGVVYKCVVETEAGLSAYDTFTVNIDKTAPTGTVSSDQINEWSSDDITLTANVTDNVSTSFSYYWQLENTSGATLTSAVNSAMTVTESGIWTGTVTVTDRAGNSTVINIPVVKIDKTTPVVSITGATSDGEFTSNGLTNKSVSLTASDSATHLSEITYEWFKNNVSLSQTDATIVITTEEVNSTYSCRITTASGKTASADFIVSIDKTAPEIESNVNNTTVTITVTDAIGLETIKISKNGSLQNENALFGVTNHTQSVDVGTDRYTFEVFDKAGNSTSKSVGAYSLDETASITHLHVNNGILEESNGVKYATVSGGCYTHSETVTNTVYKDCVRGSMDWVDYYAECPICHEHTYGIINHNWTCSICHSYFGMTATRTCTACGYRNDTNANIGTCYHWVNEGTTTKYALSCTHTNEAIGTLTLRKSTSTGEYVLNIDSTLTNATILSYEWFAEENGASEENPSIRPNGHSVYDVDGATTQSIVVPDFGMYKCNVTVRDDISGATQTLIFYHKVNDFDLEPPHIREVTLKTEETTDEYMRYYIDATDNFAVTKYMISKRSDLTIANITSDDNFFDLTESGTYYAYAMDACGNIGKKEFVVGLFPVKYIDADLDGNILQTTEEERGFRESISGAELGTDETLDKYYDGYEYRSATTATVSALKENVVYRYFERMVVSVNFIFNDSDNGNYLYETTKGKSAQPPVMEPYTVSTPGAKTTYIFDGWYDKDGKTVNLNKIDTDITVYAKWRTSTEDVVYTVNFWVDDKLVSTQRVLGGTSAREPDYTPGNGWNIIGYSEDFSKVTSDMDINILLEYLYPDEAVEEDVDLPEAFEEIDVAGLLDKEIDEIVIPVKVVEESTTEETVIDESDPEYRYLFDELTAKFGAKAREVIESKEFQNTSTAVASMGILAVLLSLLSNGIFGMGLVQGVVFLVALHHNKRFVKGAWLLSEEGIRYVDKYGRALTVDKVNGRYIFRRKNKEYAAINVEDLLQKINRGRITYKEMQSTLKTSEVYTVFDKNVKIEMSNAEARNKGTVHGNNILASIKNIAGNVGDYAVKISNGSQEFMFEVKNTMFGGELL